MLERLMGRKFKTVVRHSTKQARQTLQSHSESAESIIQQAKSRHPRCCIEIRSSPTWQAGTRFHKTKFAMQRSSSSKPRRQSRFTTTIFRTCTSPHSRFSYRKQKPNRRGRFNALRSQKRTCKELNTQIRSANKTTSTTWRIKNCRKKSRRGLAYLKKSTNGSCKDNSMLWLKTTSGK